MVVPHVMLNLNEIVVLLLEMGVGLIYLCLLVPCVVPHTLLSPQVIP